MPDDHDHDEEGTLSPHDAEMAVFHDLLHLAEMPPPGSGGQYTAVANGSWFDPGTWEGGRIPDTADAFVLIPEGVEVRYDGVSDVPLAMVRVDGALTFATGRDTKLTVDTLAVNEGGSLTIGTADQPVGAAFTAEIIIADSRFIDRIDDRAGDIDNDPTQLSLGIVSHGAVSIFGADKTAHLKVEIDPMAGDRTITLADAPEGWRVGDTIIVTGTYYVPPPPNADPLDVDGTYRTQDETFTIVAIDGDRITLSGPLVHDHDTPSPEFKATVANMTRNIEVRSADPSQLETRGHTMFMHTNAVEIHNAAFTDLGRTDKSRDLDDYVLDRDQDRVADAQQDANGEDFRLKADGRDIWVRSDPADVENQRGRYALHLHKTGTEAGEAVPVLDGNVVSGTPGWGIVQHDSNAVLIDNIAHANFGSGLMAETGNEAGAWVHNLTIKTAGRPTDPDAEGEGDVELEKDQGRNQDFGVTGTGFWFQGRILGALDNIAVSSMGAGYFYLHRGIDDVETDVDNLERPEIVYGDGSISSNRPGIELFTGNEAYAVGVGITIVGDEAPRLYNDDRSVIEDFAAWEFGRQGIHIQYSTHYTLLNIKLYGATEYTRDLGIGIKLGTSLEDVIVRNALIANVPTGIYTRDNFTDATQIAFYGEIDRRTTDLIRDYGHRYIDVDFEGVDKNYDGRKEIAGSVFRKIAPEIIDTDELENLPLTLRLDDSSLITGRQSMGGMLLDGAWLEGRKTDTLGTVDFPQFSERIYISEAAINGVATEFGYFTVGARRFVILDTLYSDRITGENDILTHTLELEAGWVLPPEARYLGVLPDIVAAKYFTLVFRGNAPVMRFESGNDVYFAAGLRDVSLPNTTLVRGSGISDRLTGTNAVDLFLGNGGSDSMAGAGGADTVIGGDGNDTVSGGGGFDQLYGGDGFDELVGGDGNDLMTGDNGNDTLLGGRSNDTLSGDDGNDFLVGDDGTTTGGADSLAGGNGEDTLAGAAGADTLRGEIGNDLIDGGSGDDSALGGAGDDALDGSDGNDALLGEDGNDTIEGGLGDDRLDGGTGVGDVVRFASAAAAIEASLATGRAIGAGTDTLAGFERLEGSRFGDTLSGDADENELVGLDGNDWLEGGGANDLMDGGAGFDVARYAGASGFVVVTLGAQGTQIATRSAGNDTLLGIEGLVGSRFDDLLTGNAGDNLLGGGDGDDRLMAMGGADTLEGGTGFDTAIFAGVGGLTFVQRADGTGSFQGGGVLRGIEAIEGTGFADRFESDGGAHVFEGEGGNDTIAGGGGADTLRGGDGIDTLTFADAGRAATVSLLGGGASLAGIAGVATLSDIEIIEGSALGDIITGSNGANTLRGGAGADTLSGADGNDRLEGGDGNDVLIHAGTGADTLFGGAGFDTASFANAANGVLVTLQGAAQAIGNGRTLVLDGIEALSGSGKEDRLTGDAAGNRLDGGGSGDRLDGAGGNDTLVGGLGADTLTGGSGSDLFVFNPGDGTDEIVDFGVGDRLSFEGFGGRYDTLAEILATGRQLGADAQLRLDNPIGGGTTTVNLDGVNLATLGLLDFLL